MDQGPDEERDIQLKFDGAPIEQQKGAPADVVVAALTALQRMVHLIGMRDEGREFGQRAKPSAKVRREFAVICKPAQPGSHVQPFDVGPLNGQLASSAIARDQLLRILKAFDSGDAASVESTIPDARERWFIADAASGLIPSDESGIQVTIRPGTRGPFSFKADRAKVLVERFKSGKPPLGGVKKVFGKVHGIDYTNSLVVLKPSGARIFRVHYPVALEQMMQTNGRKKISILGLPDLNAAGDVIDFKRVDAFSETEGALESIATFKSGDANLVAARPLRVLASYDMEDKLFVFQEASLGIDVWSDKYDTLREATLQELSMLWRNYALASDGDLDAEAVAVKEH